VNSRVLIIALAAAAVVLGGGWYLIRRSDVPPVAGEVRDADSQPKAPTEAPPAASSPGGRRAAAPPKRSEETAATPDPAVVTPTQGTLHVSSDVAGAQVFLDRVFAGAAPVTIPNVAPGPHRLNVSAEGFEGVVRDLDVQPGPADVTVRLREVLLNASVAVIHRHRVGSCNGQLSATPQAIRYDTTDRDDLFSVALDAIDAFEVDYLNKTMRLKLRGGKTFNFTDPEGNADRLFVFHRDVEKARARLAKGDVAGE
jgi:PEGA domain